MHFDHEFVSELEFCQCQNNQFLWFSELNPNVKESINLSESFVFYPTTGSKQSAADVWILQQIVFMLDCSQLL